MKTTKRVLFSSEDTDFLLIWRMDRKPHGLERYLVRPRTGQRVGELMAVDVLPSGAPRWALQRLVEEAQLVSLLSHPAITCIYGLFEHEGRTFLLKEHLDGFSVETVITLGVLRGRCMSESFCLHVADAVAGALHFAHTFVDEAGQPLGILHRSVNPGCIRIGRSGVVQLTDFVTASSLLPGRLRTPKGLVRGELDFAAPERLRMGAGEGVDARADVFSLGQVLLELLTAQSLYHLDEVEVAANWAGRKPEEAQGRRAEESSWASVEEMGALAEAYRPEHLEAVLRDVSPCVKAVVHRALRRAPHERYASAEEMRGELQACLRTIRRTPYGAQEAARELLEARTEAERSPLREKASLLEWGIFAEDVPRCS